MLGVALLVFGLTVILKAKVFATLNFKIKIYRTLSIFHVSFQEDNRWS
jgi:hypothetical protein